MHEKKIIIKFRHDKYTFDTGDSNTDDRPLRPPVGGSNIEYVASV